MPPVKSSILIRSYETKQSRGRWIYQLSDYNARTSVICFDPHCETFLMQDIARLTVISGGAVGHFGEGV